MPRTIPIQRFSICRSIPELKGVSAEVGDRLIRWVCCQRHESVIAMWITCAVVGIVAIFIGLVLAAKLIGHSASTGPADVLAILVLTLTPLALAIGAVRFVWLRTLIRQEIARGFCPRCGYSLRGLEWVHDVTMCPECGGNACLIRHEIFEKSSAVAPDLTTPA